MKAKDYMVLFRFAKSEQKNRKIRHRQKRRKKMKMMRKKKEMRKKKKKNVMSLIFMRIMILTKI